MIAFDFFQVEYVNSSGLFVPFQLNVEATMEYDV